MTQKPENATEQATPKAGKGGIVPPKSKQFGAKNGNPRNNGGVPKRFLEIRKEIVNLLDPNLTLDDYQQIVNNRNKESALRAIFAEAVLKRDIKTIFEMINQGHGKAKESIDHTTNGKELPTPIISLEQASVHRDNSDTKDN